MNVRIGEWLLDTASGELTAGDDVRQLTPKSTSLLCTLAGRPGDLVTKARLMDAVWPGTVVTDAVLTSCIRELRRAMDDDAKRPRYIETMHRRGYRLICPVEVEGAGSGTLRNQRPAIAGRDRELNQLRAALTGVRDGKRQILFVTGDPGIGKSALVDAFLDTLGTELRVARGQCIEHHGPAEAYLPVLEALDRLCRDLRGDSTKQLLARHAPGWLAQMPGLLSNAQLRAVVQRTAGATPQRLLRELTDAIEVLTADGPLVLVFEDLHWSDTATLDWLAHLARRSEPARLVVIATYRRVEALMRGNALIGVHAELTAQRLALEIPLAPLDRDAVQTVLTQRFGDSAAIRALARRVHARTEGHPLFTVNVIDELVARGALVNGAAGWTFDSDTQPVESLVPGDVRRTIEHRVRRLSHREQHILQIASIAGHEFAAAIVAAGAGEPVNEVEATLGALARNDTLIRAAGEEHWADRTTSGRFAFHHALYREVLYGRMGAAERVSAHLRIGERLERAHGERAREIAAELAIHFEQGRDSSRAVRWRQTAAQNATRRGAPQEAIAHLQRAREELRHLPSTLEHMRLEVDICIALGSQLMATGGWGAPEVEKTYSHAQRLCEELADQREVFPALWGLWLYRSGHGELREAHQLCRKLLDLSGQSDDPTIALQAHHATWATALAQGELHTCCVHAREGAARYDKHVHHALSERYGNHDAGVCAGCFHSLALTLQGDRERAIETSARAIALAEELEHPFSSAFACYFAGALHQIHGNAAMAARFAADATRLAREQSLGLILAWASCIAAWAEVRTKRSDHAIEVIGSNIDIARSTGTDLFQPYLLGLLADACLATDNIVAGRAAVERAQAAAQRSGELFYLARIQLLEAQLMHRANGADAIPHARALLHEAVALARRQGAALLEQEGALLLEQLGGEGIGPRLTAR
jgi:DNA-binding winged helix-turn-helix (wHTH) protein